MREPLNSSAYHTQGCGLLVGTTCALNQSIHPRKRNERRRNEQHEADVVLVVGVDDPNDRGDHEASDGERGPSKRTQAFKARNPIDEVQDQRDCPDALGIRLDVEAEVVADCLLARSSMAGFGGIYCIHSSAFFSALAC